MAKIIEKFSRIRDKNQEVSTNIYGDTSVETLYEQSHGNIIGSFMDQELTRDSIKPAGYSLRDSKKNLNKFKDASTGSQFAISGFELFDLTPNYPLSTFFHQDVMPIRVGGGFTETVSAQRLNFSMAEKRLAGGNTNQVEVVDALPEKFSVPAYVFKYGLIIGFVEKMKSAQVAYDAYGLRLEAIRLSYQRELDYFAFVGNLGINNIVASSTRFIGGLFNQKAGVVGRETALTDWSAWDVSAWTTNIVSILTKMLVLNAYDRQKTPDTIILPPEAWDTLSQPAAVGTLSGDGVSVVTSTIEYLKKAISTRMGYEVYFKENPYLSKNATKDTTTAGIVANGTGTGLIVFMRNDERVLRMNITQPLLSGVLAWSPTEDAWRQNHVAVVTPPMLVYPTSIYYLLNKAA